MIAERIHKLRQEMEKYGIDSYLVPTADFHESEYAGEHFAVRKYLSGFTGSAGTLVVTKTEAGLFTDGRYFIQAEHQLCNTPITLYRSGTENTPTVEKWIADKMPEKGTLGFDGRVINAKMGEKLEEALKQKEAKVCYDKDLADTIWEDRPPLKTEPIFLLGEEFSGKSTKEKLKELREKMQEYQADCFVLTSLDDIAWLFNIRGNDIPCNPVVLSYAVVTNTQAHLFLNEMAVPEKAYQILQNDGVVFHPYYDIYEFVKTLFGQVLLDKRKVNYTIYKSIKENAVIIDKPNPTTLAKAIKNPTEIENLRKAHKKDGLAVTRFMHWLKSNVGKMDITEISAADYLEERRREQEGFLELSFETIAAYNANAAMMHYSASKESNAQLKPEGFLLVDSGGQYYEGTTDITRTFVLGPVSKEWKKHYTLVVKSMLNLANAKFLHGCTGINLDILARGPLWNLGIDYRCGTGHGVGYLLNVHEGPNGFRWKVVPERNDNAVLEAGMVTTDEPGVYIENSHGIRIENELVCQKEECNEYGQFLSFETITYAPIDLDAIDTDYLNSEDIRQLNEYHAMVYETLSPYLSEEEKIWLQNYTRKI